MKYHGKFGHNIGRIQHIAPMSRIEIWYMVCRLETQNVAPTIPGLQGIKCCIKYMASHTHNPSCILLILIMDQMSSELH